MNISMGKFEKERVESLIEKPLSLYSFTDDVDMKWTHNEEELKHFIKNFKQTTNTRLSSSQTKHLPQPSHSSIPPVHYHRVSCPQTYTQNKLTPTNT